VLVFQPLARRDLKFPLGYLAPPVGIELMRQASNASWEQKRPPDISNPGIDAQSREEAYVLACRHCRSFSLAAPERVSSI